MLTRTVRRCFARSPKLKASQAVRERLIKQQQFDQLSNKFYRPMMFDHQDDVRIQYFYGKENTIAACTTNTLESTEFVLQTIKHKEPDLLMLGGMNNNELDRILQRKLSIPTSSNDLFCKNEVAEFMWKVEPKSDTYHYVDDNNTLYLVDREAQFIETHDYLTGAIASLLMEKCRVMYGRPNSILVAEDIILNRTLGELEAMFYQIIGMAKQQYRDQIFYKQRFIEVWLRELSNEHLRLDLHHKQIKYITALFKKASRNSQKCLMLLDRHWINEVSNGCVRQETDPDSIYRSYLHQDNSQRQAYEKFLRQNSPIDVLKKIAMLSTLISPDLEFLIQNEIACLDQTVFKTLFQNLSPEEISEMYEKASEQYKADVRSVQNKFILNNLRVPRLVLPVPLWPEQQYQRNDSLKETYPLGFEANSVLLDQTNSDNLKLIHDEMLNGLRFERRQRQLQLLKQYFGGQYTKENIVFYTKYFGEIMIKKGIKCKLPIHHFGKFRGYYKRLLNDKQASPDKPSLLRSAQENLLFQQSLQQEHEAEALMKLVRQKDFNPADFISSLEARGVKMTPLRTDENELPLALRNDGPQAQIVDEASQQNQSKPSKRSSMRRNRKTTTDFT